MQARHWLKAGRVKVDGGVHSPLAPQREVKVDFGSGKVDVDIDGKPLMERIPERRAASLRLLNEIRNGLSTKGVRPAL